MRAGEERDYVEYVSGRMPTLHRAAYLLCGDADRADDIVQNTLTRLYRWWRAANEADNLDAYVHRILVRVYLDDRRLPWSRVSLLGHSWEARISAQAARRDTATPPQSTVDDRDAVTSAIRRLPAGQRAVVVLRFLCDLSVADTASALNCTTGTVKSQTARGLATLRTMLPGELPTAAPGAPVDAGELPTATCGAQVDAGAAARPHPASGRTPHPGSPPSGAPPPGAEILRLA